jgi:hypothetical protein
MVEVADIFRLHGPDYRANFADRMLPSHRRAMEDICRCRTEALGGQVYYCANCQEHRYSYHSCKNRHCPKCQNDQANEWLEKQQNLLLPVTHFLVKALSPIFRAKFRDQLKKTGLFNQVDQRVWTKAWVVHSEPVGSGQAAFKYLAPYVFRVAISNNRILKLEDGQVTFKYKESATDQIKFRTIPAQEFIRRFLQHVLPDRFIKLRYYGLMSPGNRELLNQARASLGAGVVESDPTDTDTDEQKRNPVPCCPCCGTVLTLVRELKPRSGLPP